MTRLKIEITLVEEVKDRGLFSQINKQFFSVETTKETPVLTLEMEERHKLELIEKVIKVAGLGMDMPEMTPEEISEARGMVNVYSQGDYKG